MKMKQTEIYSMLRGNSDSALDELFTEADEIRRRSVGGDVHLRGLIEFSNECDSHCLYCGLRRENRSLQRYTMTIDEIVGCAGRAEAFGYGTVVLQSGESFSTSVQWLADVICEIKRNTQLAVTLSIGEKTGRELETWRKAGADRYLIRFETSNEDLYARLHPHSKGGLAGRLGVLKILRELGYEIGSGVQVGLPGQTYESLARAIAMFAELDLDMIGCGPYITGPDTHLIQNLDKFAAPPGQQVPASELMAYKVIALARIVCPKTNIPSTTALATLNKTGGYELGLSRGANVIMPNVTTPKYRELYSIYPAKAGTVQNENYHNIFHERITAAGRTVGTGPGASQNYLLPGLLNNHRTTK